MDPNENLKQQREIAKQIAELRDELCGEIDTSHKHAYHVVRLSLVNHAIRLAELVLALDQWLVKQGFLPRDWSIDGYNNNDPNSGRF